MIPLKKALTVFIVTALIGTFSANLALADDDNKGYRHRYGKRVKNIIVLVPDGCSQSTLTLARWFKGENLAIDDLHVGVVKHEMANSVITGSAAAATAFATGYKTTARFLSIGPREDDVLSTYEWSEDPESFSYKPLATVLEGAKLKGKATGLISTSRFTHATPAAWASHSNDRGNEGTDISEHMVYNEVDLVFGGGERNLVPKSQGGKRSDEEDLLAVLEDRGYAIARTETEMNAVSSLPVFGMFAWSHMDSEIDRKYDELEEPSLSAMTAKAIELLSQDEDGFFLMVEGSQVDWAGHNSDPVWMVTDFIEFDNAVKVALDFAKADGQTLILAYPDHNTGGMDIGNRAYYAELVNQVNLYWDMDISDEDAQEIKEMMNGDAGSLSYALARVISKNHTAIGWTSHGHNAEDVPLWAYGPGAPTGGLVDNTELAGMVAKGFGLNLKKIQKRLFVDLDDVFPEWELDESDPTNPVARLSKNGTMASLP